MIIEILSPSTEARDRSEKRLAYQHLASLQEYSSDGWEIETYRDNDTVQLTSINFSIPVNELYLQVANVL